MSGSQASTEHLIPRRLAGSEESPTVALALALASDVEPHLAKSRMSFHWKGSDSFYPLGCEMEIAVLSKLAPLIRI